VFTALLGVALAAMIIGCLLLILVLNRYEFKTKVSATTTAPALRSALAAIPEKITGVRL